MAYVPYGYTITDGIVTVDERAADQVRVFFEKYISGLSLAVAGEQAGIEKTHSSMGLILKNVHYLGNEVYPAIIDKETFDKAEEVRSKRAKDLGRIVELAAVLPTLFRAGIKVIFFSANLYLTFYQTIQVLRSHYWIIWKFTF